MAYKKKLTRHRWRLRTMYMPKPQMSALKQECKECGLIKITTKVYAGSQSLHYELNNNIFHKAPECKEILKQQSKGGNHE